MSEKTDKIQHEADESAAEAKRRLRLALGVPALSESVDIDAVVDCIIVAASLLTIASVLKLIEDVRVGAHGIQPE